MNPTGTELKLIDRLDGCGRIYDGVQMIGDATYSLAAIEEVPNAEYTGGQDARIAEVDTLSGIVTAPSLTTFPDLRGKRLTIELQDGSRFDFAVTRAAGATFLVKALSRRRS